MAIISLCFGASNALLSRWVLVFLKSSSPFVARDASFDYRVTYHHCFCARWLSPVKRLMALQDEREGTRLLLEESDYRLATELKRAEHLEEAGASPADQVSWWRGLH